MEQLDIRVKKNAKGELLDGPFFVRELDFDELTSLQDKHSADSIFNSHIIQYCLVDADSAPVFKPQQVKLIKSRINGSHFAAVLYVANEVNDFGAIAKYMEKYKKNSESDQKQD